MRDRQINATCVSCAALAASLACTVPAAAGSAGPEPSIEEMFAAIESALGRDAAATPAAPALPAAPLPKNAEKLDRALAEFDSLVEKGDYVAARRRVTRASADENLAGGRDVLLAAARLAEALADRRGLMRRALEAKIGEETSLWTSKGRRKGKVESVTEAGIDLATQIVINNVPQGTTIFTVRWGDLTPAEEDRLAVDWKPGGAEGALALATLAFGRGDVKAAEKVLASLAGDPLAMRLRGKIDAMRGGAAETAAEKAWRRVTYTARGKLDLRKAKKIESLLNGFEKKHGGTKFAAAKAGDIEELREMTRLATVPSFPYNFALAANGATATGGRRPEELIDGNSTKYTGSKGFAETGWDREPTPSMIVTLREAVPLNTVRVKLWDGSDRFYRYRLEVSPRASGAHWVTAVDHSRPPAERRSWQTIIIPLQFVRRIMLTGTYNSANEGFHVVELQAFHAPAGITEKQIEEALRKAEADRDE